MTKNDQCRLDNLLDIASEPPSRGGPALSEWEESFIRNLDAKFRQRQLTTKQQEAFDRIVHKHLIGDDD